MDEGSVSRANAGSCSKGIACVLLIGALVTTGALAVTTSTVVDIPHNGTLQRILYVHPDAPAANIVVLPGGDGYSGIQDDGSMITTPGRCGPVHRNRQAFADRGYAVALVDYATDNVQDVVNYLQQRDNVPTWIVGGSSSTPLAASASVKLPAASPVGVIFFSSDTINPSLGAMVKRPSLVVFSPSDVGQHAIAFYGQLTSALVRKIVPIYGGNDMSCGFHLFWGADDAFIAATTGFIAQNNSFAPSIVQTVEYYNVALDHYFITWVAARNRDLDTGVHKGWARTGHRSRPTRRRKPAPHRCAASTFRRHSATRTSSDAARPSATPPDRRIRPS